MGNHLTQSEVVRRPLLVPGELNGLPVLRFDTTSGSNDWLKFTTRFDKTIRAVFAVVREGADASGYRIKSILFTAADYDFCARFSESLSDGLPNPA